MSNSIKRLDFLIRSIKKSKKTDLWEIVQTFEEAIILSITAGRSDDSTQLIDEYEDFFIISPVPFEIEFFCIFYRSVVAWKSGDLELAESFAREVTKLAENNENPYYAARGSMALGALYSEKSRFVEALTLMKKAETELRKRGGLLFVRCLNWLGQITSGIELYQESWNYFTEALSLSENVSFKGDRGYILSNMGLLSVRMELFTQAEDCFRNSMEIHDQVGNKYGFADSMANLGMLLLKNKKLYEESAQILEIASRLQFDNCSFSKAGLVLAHYAFALFSLGNKEKANCLFNVAEKLIFSQESTSEQTEYYSLRAELFLSEGNLDKAEKFVFMGKRIEEHSNYKIKGSDFCLIHSKILFEKGEYKFAYSQLQQSVEESKKIEIVKTSAMESVIYALTETAKTKRKLARIEEEAKILEDSNAVLKLSEERFRKLINRMRNIGVLAVNLQGIVTFWNNTCEDFYGYDAGEALGKELLELIVPDHLKEWFTGFIKDRKISKGFDINLKTKGRALKSVLVSLIPLNENEIFLIQVDLTSQRQAENQRSLIEAQMRRTQKLEALGTLAGGIAHDFNNLLQGILGNVSLLCNALDKDSSLFVKAERIQSAAEKSAELCSQMLDYAGTKPVGHELLDLNDVINDISILLETSLSKGVVLVMNLSKSLPLLIGDKSQIRQVIMNLILNAAESIEGIGQVQVSTDFVHMSREQFQYNLLEESPDEGNYLLFEVLDNGSGIDPVTLTKIFDPFFSTKKTGRGLGLAAVLGIIRGHSGAVTVESKLGYGTKFSVYLRSAPEVVEVVEKQEESFLNEGFSGRKILVVDDEEIVRETLQAMLTAQGYIVDTQSGGAEALEVFKRGDIPDLLVLDLTMPGLNGAEVFIRLRNMGMSFPVLVVSGYCKEQISSLFTEEIPEGFLQKPFSSDSLRNKVVEIFNKLKL